MSGGASPNIYVMLHNISHFQVVYARYLKLLHVDVAFAPRKRCNIYMGLFQFPKDL